MDLLVPHLAQYGITGGLVRSSQAAFSSDLLHENQELAQACRPHDGFRALPVVHPGYGFWRDIQTQAVLLLPSFQNYSLLDGRTLDMARTMAKNGHVFVISLREEDERALHPLCQVKPPSTADIQAFAEAIPQTPVIVLNAYFGECGRWSAGNIYFDIAFYEPFNITEALLAAPKGHVLFGSHAPFFVASAAFSKLQDGMPEEDAQAIARDNALAILRA